MRPIQTNAVHNFWRLCVLFAGEKNGCKQPSRPAHDLPLVWMNFEPQPQLQPNVQLWAVISGFSGCFDMCHNVRVKSLVALNVFVLGTYIDFRAGERKTFLTMLFMVIVCYFICMVTGLEKWLDDCCRYCNLMNQIYRLFRHSSEMFAMIRG